METWRMHPRWTDYEVSDCGRVRRLTPALRTRPGYILARVLDKDGYPIATMKGRGIQKVRRVHSLVLETFVGPRGAAQQARHMDGSKDNNLLTNLCWGTATENQRDRVRHGTTSRGSQHGQAKLTYTDVVEIRKRYRPWVVSFQMLAKEYGVSCGHVASIVNRHSRKHA